MKKLLIILSLVMVASFCISAPRKARRRLQLAASGAFSPLDLGAKLAIWYDASDISTLLDASDNVCTNSVKIKTWSDKSGNDRDAIQATADNQPTCQTGVQNGLAVIRTDGNDQLDIASSAGVFRNKTAGHIFIVLKNLYPSSSSKYPLFISFFRNVVNSQRFGVYGRRLTYPGIQVVGRRLDTDLFISSGGSLSTDYILVHCFADWGGGNIRASFNGSSYFSANYSSGAGQSADTDGAGATIFSSYVTNLLPDGSEIGVIVVINAEMSDSEITKLETYLSDKWGL